MKIGKEIYCKLGQRIRLLKNEHPQEIHPGGIHAKNVNVAWKHKIVKKNEA